MSVERQPTTPSVADGVLSHEVRKHRRATSPADGRGEQKRKTFVIDFVNKPEEIRTAFEPYFTNATLETETDPYVVVHLATKLAQAGIYTEDQVREVARLWVERKGNNAVSAALRGGRLVKGTSYSGTW